MIHAVDFFVVFDDVNFINCGWINRNYILARGERSRITLELQGASQNLLINQVSVGNNRIKLLKSIQHAYGKAPRFKWVFPMIEELLMNKEPNLARYLDNSIKRIAQYLDLNPHWIMSSELNKDSTLRGQDKVLAICNELGTSNYINMPGGKELYDYQSFELEGINLSFIQPASDEYAQFGRPFVPYLSIIDVMMFNDQEQCLELLRGYELA